MHEWSDWFALWKAEAKRAPVCPLFTKPGNDWAVVVAAIKAAEKKVQPKVDAACRSWIRTGRWPRMTAKVRWFAHWRCVKAARACIVLMAPGTGGHTAAWVSPHMTEAEIKDWFLIGLWTWGWGELCEELERGGDGHRSKFLPGRN